MEKELEIRCDIGRRLKSGKEMRFKLFGSHSNV